MPRMIAQYKAHMKDELAHKQGGKYTSVDGHKEYWTPCFYCGNRYLMADLTFDHVVRKRDGGRFTFDNLVLACLLCNAGREQPTSRYLLERQKRLLRVWT